MFISQKSRYALRAIFELAKRANNGHMKIVNIARAQNIPPRFLEVILGQLKQGGFVESRRGSDGGYVLVRPPAYLSVGEVLRFIQGAFEPVDTRDESVNTLTSEAYAFKPLWDDIQSSVAKILDATTFAELIEHENNGGNGMALNYMI